MQEQTKEIFSAWGRYLEIHSDDFSRIGGTYCWVFDDGATWTLDCTSAPKVFEGRAAGSEVCEIRVTEKNFVSLVEAKLDPQDAFLSGQLKLFGGVDAAMKLRQVLDGLITS